MVTGSSSGIGLGIARGFNKQGANLILNGRNEEKFTLAAQTLGDSNRITTIAGDIGYQKTGKKMAQVALDRFGSVDVLVNNAGIFGIKLFLENTEEDLDRYTSGNLKGITL